jgi:hypothetical protein
LRSPTGITDARVGRAVNKSLIDNSYFVFRRSGNSLSGGETRSLCQEAESKTP